MVPSLIGFNHGGKVENLNRKEVGTQAGENNEETRSIWWETVQPADDLVWWFTNAGD
jgi:hypothetical protein